MGVIVLTACVVAIWLAANAVINRINKKAEQDDITGGDYNG